jgi:hypothetical protein
MLVEYYIRIHVHIDRWIDLLPHIKHTHILLYTSLYITYIVVVVLILLLLAELPQIIPLTVLRGVVPDT